MVDTLGNPLAFALSNGQAPDLEFADARLPQFTAEALIADKQFDTGPRVLVRVRGADILVVIPSKANRKTPRDYDK